MVFGSLFAGIGGLDLGLERAGMTCSWQVEKDEYCRQVLAKHWPDVPRREDIFDSGRKNLQRVELVCGGFPCQPFSHAGKRRGEADDRYLWPEMFRVVQELKPTWFLGENVPGIINMALDQVLDDLESEGYETQALCIPACATDAPHIRERVWILAHAACKRRREEGPPCERSTERTASRSALPDTASSRLEGPAGEILQRQSTRSTCSSRMYRGWQPEPNVGRVAHGVPRRVDRLRALGNAVVPQVAEQLGRMILQAEGGS